MNNVGAHTVLELMQKSELLFGTSGVRGTVAAMTDKACYGFTVGFLQYLAEVSEFGPGGEVALAGDLRPSTPRLLAACAQAISDMGGKPVFCGYIPTPALALYAFERSIPSLMVTGSHIPADRNGIKFYRARGEVLKDDEAGITRQGLTFDSSIFDAFGALKVMNALPEPVDAVSGYIRRYLDFYGPDALGGMRIGVYQHSAVGRDIVTEIVKVLGGQAIPLGRSENFIPVDTEAIRPEDVELGSRWSREFDLDAIVSTDGDSDRPLIADHAGTWLRGDVLGVLCAQALGADCVVTPVSSNTLLEKCGSFHRTVRTRIGSPYVISAMLEASKAGANRVCGYEANGGFLVGSDIEIDGRRLGVLLTRDAVLPMVSALVAARPERLADMLSRLPERVTYSDRLQEFPVEHSRSLMKALRDGPQVERERRAEALFGPIGGEIANVDLTDGFRMIFKNGVIIHLRPSGNAPELRCYTEAASVDEAARLNVAVFALLVTIRPWE